MTPDPARPLLSSDGDVPAARRRPVPPPVFTVSDPGDGDHDGKPRNASEVWDRLQALPSMHEDPLVWDHRVGGFVPRSDLAGAPAPPAPSGPAPAPPPPPPAAAPPHGRRHVVVDAGAAPAPPSSAPPPPPPPPPGPPGSAAPMSASRPAPPRPAPPRPVAPAPRPAAAVAPAPPRARRRRPKVLRRVLGVFLSVPLLLLVIGFGFGWYKFSQIPRAQVSSALSPVTGGGTNYLIVGTDSREGIDPNDPNAGAFLGEKVTGARTDSIMVLHVEGDTQSLLSVPRDLWVKDPATGEMGRINSTFESGPTNLIKAVQSIGIPVHHYLEINFVSFGKLVDAVGGIDVTFDYPARDANSGLNITTAGVNHLDGTQALAYVRSRHYEELKNGTWVTDPRSDLGRVERQRSFLTALMNKVTDTKNPVKLGGITDAMSVGLKIDDALNLLDAMKLAWKLKGFHPTSGSLPVTPRTTSGGAAVLDLKQPDATTLIGQFNNGGLPPSATSTTTTAPAPPTTAKKK